MGWQWPAVGSGELNTTFLVSPCEGGCHYCHYLYYSLASGQTTERNHSSMNQQKNGLKIYWAWPRPSEQDSDSVVASPSYWEAFTSLLSLSIRGQKGKNNYRKLAKLITWIIALSNSMKLWVMPLWTEVKWSRSVVSDSLQPHGLQPIRLLRPWDFPRRVLEWIAISFFRGSSGPRNRTQVSCIAGRYFTVWATREARGPTNTDGSWWRVLTKRGPLEKRMANHFTILVLRTSWTVL